MFFRLIFVCFDFNQVLRTTACEIHRSTSPWLFISGFCAFLIAIFIKGNKLSYIFYFLSLILLISPIILEKIISPALDNFYKKDFEEHLISKDCESLNTHYPFQKYLYTQTGCYSATAQCDKIKESKRREYCFMDFESDRYAERYIKNFDECDLLIDKGLSNDDVLNCRFHFNARLQDEKKSIDYCLSLDGKFENYNSFKMDECLRKYASNAGYNVYYAEATPSICNSYNGFVKEYCMIDYEKSILNYDFCNEIQIDKLKNSCINSINFNILISKEGCQYEHVEEKKGCINDKIIQRVRKVEDCYFMTDDELSSVCLERFNN